MNELPRFSPMETPDLTADRLNRFRDRLNTSLINFDKRIATLEKAGIVVTNGASAATPSSAASNAASAPGTLINPSQFAPSVGGSMTLITLASTDSPYSAALNPAKWTLFLVATGAGGDFTLNLPVVTGSGNVAVVVKTDLPAHDVVITPSGSDRIAGAATYPLTTQFQSVILIDGGTGEWVVA